MNSLLLRPEYSTAHSKRLSVYTGNSILDLSLCNTQSCFRKSLYSLQLIMRSALLNSCYLSACSWLPKFNEGLVFRLTSLD
jgi:hypothetical protein